MFPTPPVKRERCSKGEARTTMTSVRPRREGFHKNDVERVKFVARFYIVFAFSNDGYELRDTNTMTLGVGFVGDAYILLFQICKFFLRWGHHQRSGMPSLFVIVEKLSHSW
ncbi:unnamed protein product [Lactuca virosa]|uniref:Uncharacterized protein n=1 Tax=Lactuca virosa TaxID=75947 RepID=A0AAU9PJ58_9ASTR|nr:unnamed protein product [Lactuca virosa]